MLNRSEQPVFLAIPYFASAWETATATATVMPTIGLLPPTASPTFCISKHIASLHFIAIYGFFAHCTLPRPRELRPFVVNAWSAYSGANFVVIRPIHGIQNLYGLLSHLIGRMYIYPPRCHFALMSQAPLNLFTGNAGLFKFRCMGVPECMEIKCRIPKFLMNHMRKVLHDTWLNI